MKTEQELIRSLKGFGGFSAEQCDMSTNVANMQDDINKLLDDDLMMQNSNKYALEERRLLTRLHLTTCLLQATRDTREIEDEIEYLVRVVR